MQQCFLQHEFLLDFWNTAFSALTLLVGCQVEHLACKKWSGTKCKLFAYCPADATAIPKPHHLLRHLVAKNLTVPSFGTLTQPNGSTYEKRKILFRKRDNCATFSLHPILRKHGGSTGVPSRQLLAMEYLAITAVLELTRFGTVRLTYLAVRRLGRVHLIDADNQLFDAERECKEGMLASLAVLRDACLKLTSTGRHHQHRTVGLQQHTRLISLV